MELTALSQVGLGVFLMPRKLQDANNELLVVVLETMLAADRTISQRAAAAEHPDFKNASDINRNARRKAMVDEYERRQKTLRSLTAKVAKTGTTAAAEKIQNLESRVKVLEENERARVVGHLALIQSVAEMGGTAKLKRFYKQYAEVRDRLSRERSVPSEVLDP